jgi:hypothetical protein
LDDGQVVLDNQNGAPFADLPDQRYDLSDVVVCHPGGRLIEQQHPRIDRQCGCDLESALASVWQAYRRALRNVGKPDVVEQQPSLVLE